MRAVSASVCIAQVFSKLAELHAGSVTFIKVNPIVAVLGTYRPVDPVFVVMLRFIARVQQMYFLKLHYFMGMTRDYLV